MTEQCHTSDNTKITVIYTYIMSIFYNKSMYNTGSEQVKRKCVNYKCYKCKVSAMNIVRYIIWHIICSVYSYIYIYIAIYM